MAEAALQLDLWEDVRLPETYFQHYHRTGHCLNCRMKLRHPLHAFNHYKKFHMVKPVPKYFVWSGVRFVQCSKKLYTAAKKAHRATAHTKVA